MKPWPVYDAEKGKIISVDIPFAILWAVYLWTMRKVSFAGWVPKWAATCGEFPTEKPDADVGPECGLGRGNPDLFDDVLA
mgnify:CR=1 FL=1